MLIRKLIGPRHPFDLLLLIIMFVLLRLEPQLSLSPDLRVASLTCLFIRFIAKLAPIVSYFLYAFVASCFFLGGATKDGYLFLLVEPRKHPDFHFLEEIPIEVRMKMLLLTLLVVFEFNG
jgi:hypothetical protein